MFSEIGSHVALQCILTIGLAFGESASDVENLMTLLFTTRKYNKNIRPVANQRTPVKTSVNFKLNSIIDFDDGNEVLKTANSLEIFWTDEYLQWNITEYNNTAYLILVLQSSCDLDIRYIPFDVQTCYLLFTARSYFKPDVRLAGGYAGIYRDEYKPNSMWDLLSIEPREVETVKSEVLFEIKLKRKPAFYIINIIVPFILLAILNTFTFVLPITSGERSSFAVTVFLSMAVFLTIVAESLPKNSDSVALLSVYMILMTVSSTLIVVLCLVEARLATPKHDGPPYWKRLLGFV